MRTRRSRGLKQTRKGGNPEENRRNWETYWSDKPYNPYTKYPRGVQGRFYGTLTPTVSRELNMKNTYIIQRHGFSCANLQKVKDEKKYEGTWYPKALQFHYRVEDPSLTAYGIYSLLREEERHPAYTGTVFGSSLLRTWQTILLVYGKFGPVRVIVSPYIKEKHGFALDLSNMPLPFEQQMEIMGQFMNFLAEIDHPIAREIIRHEHIIQYNGDSYPLGPYQPQATIKLTSPIAPPPKENKPSQLLQFLRDYQPEPIPPSPPEYNYAPQSDYLETFKAFVKTDQVSQEVKIERNGHIPAITDIPEPSFREYYGAEGFVYFDRWVRTQTQAATIFVVSHSKWMQKVIKEYCGTVVTKIFDENAWKLIIAPASKYKTGAGVTFEIIRGLPKPTYDELDHMNRVEEPTCNVIPRPRTMPASRPPPPREPLPLPRSREDPSEENVESLNEENEEPINADDIEVPYRASEDPFDVRSRSESQSSQVSQPNRASQVSQSSQGSQASQASQASQVSQSSQGSQGSQVSQSSQGSQVSQSSQGSQGSQGSQASQGSKGRSSQFSLVKEVSPTESKLVTVPVTTEKTHIIVRSFVELSNMMLDSTIRAGLRKLILSREDFNTKVTNYVNSNPRVMILDPSSFLKPRIPIYLFQNHYLAFVLMFKEEFEELLDYLPTSSVVLLALKTQGLTVNIVVSFLRDLRQFIEDDAVFHNLLLSTFAANANTHYAFLTTKREITPKGEVEKDIVYSFTLLDLFMFEIQRHPITTDNIYFMYGCFIDLLKYGARCSAVVYEQPPPSMLSSIYMPMVELERLPEEMALTQRWEREKRALDPENKLARYQEEFEEITRTLRLAEHKLQSSYKLQEMDPVARAVALEKIQKEFYARNRPLLDAVERIRRDYHAEKQKLGFDKLPMIRDEINKKFEKSIYIYLNGQLATYLPEIPQNPNHPQIQQIKEVNQAHKDIFTKLLYSDSTEPVVSIGGLRGTSWKKTLLRQSSVKAGRYRASLYKGKRRTRANRS